jgi:hypothetical protein
MPTPTRHPRPVDWSCRFYAFLVRAYSPHFRERYGTEMVRVFGDCCAAAFQCDGTGALMAVWARALLDLGRNAPADRAQDLVRDPGARRLLIALAPVAVLLAALICVADVLTVEIQGPLYLLLLFTALLGLAHPRAVNLWAVVLGASVPATLTLARWRGWHLPYPTDPATPLYALLALVPAFLGAHGGAWVRRLLRRCRANLQTPAFVLAVVLLTIVCCYQGVGVLDRKAEFPVAKMPYDPWHTLVRAMDPTSLVFRLS